jgi:hypothetical protein
MARVAGANEKDIAKHIVWPGAIPYSFAGFRIAAPYSIGGAVVGELISSNRGLGYMIQAGATDFDTTTVFVSLFTLTMIVVLSTGPSRTANAGCCAGVRARARAQAGCPAHERGSSPHPRSPRPLQEVPSALRPGGGSMDSGRPVVLRRP